MLFLPVSPSGAAYQNVHCFSCCDHTSAQVQDARKGMAGFQADPAALLRVLMKHGQMEQAAALALQYLRAWQTEVKLWLCCVMGCQQQTMVAWHSVSVSLQMVHWVCRNQACRSRCARNSTLC